MSAPIIVRNRPRKAGQAAGGTPCSSPHRGHPSTSDVYYDVDETEFIVAVGRFKVDWHKPFPTLAELLGILKSLGWRKPEPEPNSEFRVVR